MRLQYLASLTLHEIKRLLRLRLPLSRNGPAWTVEELLSSAKHGRGIRFAELLLRQEAIVRRHLPWEPLAFERAQVLEIGCGPLGGYGPLAIFCGAERFASAEPEWDENLFFSEAVRERYLRVFHADLTALYGPRMEFDAFVATLRARMQIHKSGFAAAPFAGSFDVVLSQSCLEHVFPLDSTIARLAAVQSPQARFLHLVDFGNHYPTVNPFEGLYEQPPADYIARRGKAINLLRVTDIAVAFSQHGLNAQIVMSRRAAGNYPGMVHPWWRERYADEALFTQLVLVAGPA